MSSKENELAINLVSRVADTQTCLSDGLREAMRTVVNMARRTTETTEEVENKENVVATMTAQLNKVYLTKIDRVGHLKVSVLSSGLVNFKAGLVVGLLKELNHGMVVVCPAGNPLETVEVEQDLVDWFN